MDEIAFPIQQLLILKYFINGNVYSFDNHVKNLIVRMGNIINKMLEIYSTIVPNFNDIYIDKYDIEVCSLLFIYIHHGLHDIKSYKNSDLIKEFNKLCDIYSELRDYKKILDIKFLFIRNLIGNPNVLVIDPELNIENYEYLIVKRKYNKRELDSGANYSVWNHPYFCLYV